VLHDVPTQRRVLTPTSVTQHPVARPPFRRLTACAGTCTRKRRSDQQVKLPATHACVRVAGLSLPASANRLLPAIGTERRAPHDSRRLGGYARASPYDAAIAQSGITILGSHRDGSNLALEVSGISLLPIGNWPQEASLTCQSSCIVGIGLWHAVRGDTLTLFIFLFFVCLPVLFVCLHSLRSLVIGPSIDQCPRLSEITMGPGSPAWAPPGSPSDALQKKVFLPRRDGDIIRCIAWLRSVADTCNGTKLINTTVSVVDDDEALSRRHRREERRARLRHSAGLSIEPLNILTSDRVSSDRTNSATASRHSIPGPSLAPREPGEERQELLPAGCRADSGIASPPKHRVGISHRARGPEDGFRGFWRCSQAPEHPSHTGNLAEHDYSSHPQIPVTVVSQTHRPTWYRRAAVLRRNDCQQPTGPPRKEYYPRGRLWVGETQSDQGPEARAGTKFAARGHPHPWCLHCCADRQPTIRLREQKTHFPRHQAPRHQKGLLSPRQRP